jgi:hypothetical protein
MVVGLALVYHGIKERHTDRQTDGYVDVEERREKREERREGETGQNHIKSNDMKISQVSE